MGWTRRSVILGLLVALSATAARADSIAGWKWPGGPPAPKYYSPCRYWTPTCSRIYDCLYGPKTILYPPDRHPEVPANYYMPTYPTASALPGQTIVPTIPPPITSPAR